jgi:hypothetical protein
MALEKYPGVKELKPFINIELVLERMVPFQRGIPTPAPTAPTRLNDFKGMGDFAYVPGFPHKPLIHRGALEDVGGNHAARLSVNTPKFKGFSFVR